MFIRSTRAIDGMFRPYRAAEDIGSVRLSALKTALSSGPAGDDAGSPVPNTAKPDLPPVPRRHAGLTRTTGALCRNS